MKRYKDMTDMEKEDFKALCIVVVGGIAYTVVDVDCHQECQKGADEAAWNICCGGVI